MLPHAAQPSASGTAESGPRHPGQTNPPERTAAGRGFRDPRHDVAQKQRQRAAIDLPLAFQRYRSAGGADDTEAFRRWLAEQYPPVVELPAETSTETAAETQPDAVTDAEIAAASADALSDTAADASLQTITMTPVEVSLVLPARFAVGLGGDANRTRED